MQRQLLIASALATALTMGAAPLKVCDFEDYEIGATLEMWNCFGGETTSTATVEADPKNPDNKVLHVRLNDWNTFVEIGIPTSLTGPEITSAYQTLMVDVYRAASDQNDWKQFRIWLGDEEIHTVDGYPHQGDKSVWQQRQYPLNAASADNNSSILHLGMHSESSDYYIDNIVLKGMFDDYITVDDGVIDICKPNTSSSYVTYSTPLYITMDTPVTVYTSRYTEFKPAIAGDGPLTLMCGGERTFLGDQNGSAYPDWSYYTGYVHIYPYRQVEASAGFYGAILNHGGKRFNPEDIEASLATTNSQLINNRLIVHEGATLATPTGIRGVRIGHLDLEEGSRLWGSIKTGTSNASYIVVGHDGTDATLAGRIAPAEKSGKPDPATMLGIIKEGEGTYRITGNDNLITAAIRITAGSVMLDNDAEAAAANKLGGAIGSLGANTPGVYVFEGTTLGGNGNAASVVDLYGTIAPGDGGTGTLAIADYTTGAPVNLRLRPSSRLRFELQSAADHDRLDVSGNLDYYNIGQDFQTSDRQPIVYIEPADDNTLQPGDRITLISAAGKTSLNDVDWGMRIQYPRCCTWQVDEIVDEQGYRLVATVVSLDYSGQGDTIIDDDNPGEGDDDDDDDGYDETADNTPLRTYADAIGTNIGVAVSTWRYNPYDASGVGSIISREFNLVVAENEMKFDATEPSRGTFSFGDGDRIVNFATQNDMLVRGHALAWHKQMPTWLSSDGGVKNNNNYTRDELLQILERHITAVLTHYRGKIVEWDVVNECLSDDQSIIRTDPDGYTLRPSIWLTGIGEDYIDSAFVYAHRADPQARLILNEYGAEFKGVAKTEALYNLARRLVESGIPIHGVGLQCHLDASEVDGQRLSATIDSYTALGLTVSITELDLGIDAINDEQYELQAKAFRAIAKAAVSNPNCTMLVLWGISDDYSWRSSHPLLWDASHRPKPAYYAVHSAFRRQAEANAADDITCDSNHGPVVASRYISMQGLPVTYPSNGIYIRVDTYADGTVKTSKVAIR